MKKPKKKSAKQESLDSRMVYYTRLAEQLPMGMGAENRELLHKRYLEYILKIKRGEK